MVHQAGGIVEIDSRLGSGTTVRMVIPIAEPIPAAEGAIASEDAEATVSGLTRILVIDHDAGVRRFLVLLSHKTKSGYSRNQNVNRNR